MARWAGALACAALLASQAHALTPQTHWQLLCMGCHHPDGAGEPGRVPSLRDTLVPFGSREDGRAFMIRVPGVAQSTLKDDAIADLLNWMVQHLSSTPAPADFRPFTTAEVTAARSAPLAAVKQERARLLRSLAAHSP